MSAHKWEAPAELYFYDEWLQQNVKGKLSCGNNRYVHAARIAELEAEVERLREEVAALKSPPEEYCAKCGAPKSNHPYRHPFVSRATLDKRKP